MRVPIPNMKEFNPPKYMCKRANKPFVLDGDINKDFWADAPFTELFIDIEGEHMPKPRFETKAKMLWDDEYFYFAAELIGDEIWATITKRDEVIFFDNDFEIFIDPDSDTHQYFEFEMNAFNTIWDLFLTKPYRDYNGRPINNWDINGLKSAVKVDGEINNPNADNKKWSVEVAIPFKVLKECANRDIPKVGDFYRVNFSRVQWTVDVKDGKYEKTINPETGRSLPEDNWVWAKTGLINIHYPELWGFVFFVNDNESFEVPDDEKIKWELRKLYYAQHKYFDENGEFCKDISVLTNGEDLKINPTVETTKNCFEIHCDNSDKTKTVSIFADGLITIK